MRIEKSAFTRAGREALRTQPRLLQVVAASGSGEIVARRFVNSRENWYRNCFSSFAA
jgi:hypothetical protein